VPLWAIQIEAQEPPDTLAKRLAGDTTTPGWRWATKGALSFEGWVRFPWFILAVNRPYINSFAPVLLGRFSPAGSGTCIRALLVLHPLTAAFIALVFWLSTSPIFHFIVSLLAFCAFVFEARRARGDLQSSMLIEPAASHAA
jgi:hypothetical protein